MAAALQAASAGISVALLDEGSQLGGHFYKSSLSNIALPLSSTQRLKQIEFQSLLEAIQKSDIKIYQGARVWGIFDREGKTLTLNGDSSPQNQIFRIGFEPIIDSQGWIETRSIIIATGVFDRPIPFPGWEMPGVVTPGAVQIQLEKQALIPGQRVIIAGSGPLQLVVAAELIRCGVEVVAVLDTSALFDAWQRMFAAMGGLKTRFSEGFHALLTIMRKGVPILFRHAVFKALGSNERGVQGVVYGRIDQMGNPVYQTAREAQVDVICCAYGFSPSISLTLHMGCRHVFDPLIGAWKPFYDEKLQTSVAGVFVAGDVTTVGGKPLAQLQGRWAAISALQRLGAWSEEQVRRERSKIISAIRREEKFAQWLWQRYRVLPGLFQIAEEETLVCRCEAVRVADVRLALEDGSYDLFGIKLRTRLGMGQCQGRYCFSNAAMLISLYSGRNASEIDLPTIRPPIVPVRLGYLATCRQFLTHNEEV